ncbi:hypothetical protein [Mangrovibacillus cuniculi]|uniref:Uncharacterized protein n=1 Tax=Mangrovibacillus cuniculi TaxID=2593652 RepID=A0A7S8CBS9_9BACI|nr:hypothetical protein [Mangrovibacillus cuniculi]QPC47102.1 hypothetical protein G8O30_09050 [Mangrovibacillus cuniculi]
MGAYLGQRIIYGAFTYEYVIERRPDLKNSIDVYLIEKERQDLMTA